MRSGTYQARNPFEMDTLPLTVNAAPVDGATPSTSGGEHTDSDPHPVDLESQVLAAADVATTTGNSDGRTRFTVRKCAIVSLLAAAGIAFTIVSGAGLVGSFTPRTDAPASDRSAHSSTNAVAAWSTPTPRLVANVSGAQQQSSATASLGTQEDGTNGTTKTMTRLATPMPPVALGSGEQSG